VDLNYIKMPLTEPQKPEMNDTSLKEAVMFFLKKSGTTGSIVNLCPHRKDPVLPRSS
jgi:hypothetical protein